jgi:hypothetical protein
MYLHKHMIYYILGAIIKNYFFGNSYLHISWKESSQYELIPYILPTYTHVNIVGSLSIQSLVKKCYKTSNDTM